MIARAQLKYWSARAYWFVMPAVLVAAVVVSTVRQPDDHIVLTMAVRIAAALLLAGVICASVQVAHRWRTVSSHDSIRADIAASGGLGHRLMV